MQDFEFVQTFQPLYYLNDNLPYVFFLHELLVVLALADALEHIAIVSKLHDNAVRANLSQV